MAIQLDQYPATERKRLVAIGEDFGSDATTDQATKTLQAFDKFKDLLVGFTEEDAQELREARELLAQHSKSRDSKQGSNKVSRKDVLVAFKEAKPKRITARSVLTSARLSLAKKMGREREIQMIDAVLAETSHAGADVTLLTRQLNRLVEVLSAPELSEEVNKRKGQTVLDSLNKSLDLLQTKKSAKSEIRGTPEETERINLLDGIIVELVREARRAARAASSETGNKAIAEEFELTYLYPAEPKPKIEE